MTKFFDTRGAIAYLREAHGVARTEPTMRRYRVQGLGPKFHKMGNSVSYADADLDAWVAARRTAHNSTASYPPESRWRRPNTLRNSTAGVREDAGERERQEMFGRVAASADG